MLVMFSRKNMVPLRPHCLHPKIKNMSMLNTKALERLLLWALNLFNLQVQQESTGMKRSQWDVLHFPWSSSNCPSASTWELRCKASPAAWQFVFSYSGTITLCFSCGYPPLPLPKKTTTMPSPSLMPGGQNTGALVFVDA